MLGKAATGQENSEKNGFFKTWEKPGKIYVFERSQGMVKVKVNMKLYILSWPFS